MIHGDILAVEPKIVIGQPVYQKSTMRVNTEVSSGICLAFI